MQDLSNVEIDDWCARWLVYFVNDSCINENLNQLAGFKLNAYQLTLHSVMMKYQISKW